MANQDPKSPDCEGTCLAVKGADDCLALIVTIRLTLQTRILDTQVTVPLIFSDFSISKPN
jgi:hypothetical protein